MDTKVCRTCGIEKSKVECFPAHKQMADGFLSFCKPCVSKKRSDRRLSDDKVREYDRQRSKLPHRRAHLTQNSINNRKKYPEKYKARTAVGNAVRDGRLKKAENCSLCGTSDVRITGHHEDYSKPLEVKWMCTLCHARLERGLMRMGIPA